MRTVARAVLLGVVILAWVFVIASCVSAKSFYGQVVDADTKEPIEGAVVVAYWYKARMTTVGEESLTPKDVKETLTDKNGQWTITGPKGRMHDLFPYFSTITGIYYTKEPEFIIFKPGYCSWPNGFSIGACKGRMRSEGPGENMVGKRLELPKLTEREDRLRAQSISLAGGESALEKQRELIRLINEERRNLGLQEIYR